MVRDMAKGQLYIQMVLLKMAYGTMMFISRKN